MLCAFPAIQGWPSSPWQCVLEEAATQQPTMAWLGEFSSKSPGCPKPLSAPGLMCTQRYLCHLSGHCGDVEPAGAHVQLSASQMRVAGGSLQPCHALEPAGLLLREQQAESSSLARVPANQHTSASSETLRSFIGEREVTSGRGVTSPSVPCQGGDTSCCDPPQRGQGWDQSPHVAPVGANSPASPSLLCCQPSEKLGLMQCRQWEQQQRLSCS